MTCQEWVISFVSLIPPRPWPCCHHHLHGNCLSLMPCSVTWSLPTSAGSSLAAQGPVAPEHLQLVKCPCSLTPQAFASTVASVWNAYPLIARQTSIYSLSLKAVTTLLKHISHLQADLIIPSSEPLQPVVCPFITLQITLLKLLTSLSLPQMACSMKAGAVSYLFCALLSI